MKAKFLAAIIAMLALYSVVSAQDYQIRTNGRNNLRAAPSLDGTFVETVPSGTILHVIGKQNRWLKISRNGREVWMADWLGYSRVEGIVETASPPASNIDNCCFVDRQCNSDQQWTDGYYAFQNSQCAAPSQSQPQASAQPAGQVPSSINNCCFVNQQCHSEQDWEQGFYAYLSSQCPVSGGAPRVAWTSYMPAEVNRFLTDPSKDPFNNCCYMHHGTCHSDKDWERGRRDYRNHECIRPAPLGTRPAIVGNAKFRNLVETALELIGIHAPEWLHYIDNSGALMFEALPDQSGGFYNQRWSIAHGWTSFENGDPSWAPDNHYIVGYAGGITHEACHAIQQRTYTQTAGRTNEAACVEAQLAVIEAINPDSIDVPWLRASVASYK